MDKEPGFRILGPWVRVPPGAPIFFQAPEIPRRGLTAMGGLRPLHPRQGSQPLDPVHLTARGPAGAFRNTPPSPGAAPPNVNDLTDGTRSGKNYGENPGNRSMP